jgi:hypothetical protein
MANVFQTQPVTRTALQLLLPDLVFARTVNRDYEADFGGGTGNTVMVRKPIVLAARERAYGATSAITIDEINEPPKVPIEIDRMVYSAVALTDEDLTFEIRDFAEQVLQPQVAGVAFDVEKAVLEVLQTADASTASWGDNPLDAFLVARKELRDMSAPMNNLYAAVGTGVAAELLGSDYLRRADASASTGALRDAIIGRIHGFDVIESNALGEDEAIFYHRDAFTLAVRAPRVPDGVPFGQSVAEGGFALRWIQDYDPMVLRDRSVVSTFIGTAKMEYTKRELDSTTSTVTPAVRIAPSGAGSTE